MLRRSFLAALGATALSPIARAGKIRNAALYKNPDCGCCDDYAKYLKGYDFAVDIVETPELDKFRAQKGVPQELAGCHTMLVEGYVVEGHVPVKAIERMLSQKPKIAGIALPGMPAGSPGMTGKKEKPFTIYAFGGEAAGKSQVYFVE